MYYEGVAGAFSFAHRHPWGTAIFRRRATNVRSSTVNC